MCAALKDTREKRERTAFLALKEIWASRATGVNLDQQDPEEKMAQRGQRVVQVFQEMLVHLDQLVRRVNLVSLGYQDIQEDKDQRDLRVSKVSLEPMGRKEHEEQEENLAHADREDQRDLEGREDQGGQQEKRGPRVTLELTALQDLLERGVCLDLKAQQDFLALKGLLDLQAKMDCLDILGREERLASKERQALLVHQVWSDLRGQQVRLDQWVIGVTQDPPALLESRVSLVLQEKKGLRVTLALLAPLVRMVLLVQEVSLEREACRVLWELMA